jgi:hypothetical protein
MVNCSCVVNADADSSFSTRTFVMEVLNHSYEANLQTKLH